MEPEQQGGGGDPFASRLARPDGPAASGVWELPADSVLERACLDRLSSGPGEVYGATSCGFGEPGRAAWNGGVHGPSGCRPSLGEVCTSGR